MKPLRPITLGLCLALLPALALSQGAPPTNDQVNCSAWATQQTGYNPAQPPPTAVPNQQVAGSGSRARGAAGGAAIGAMAGNAGAGAAAGAVAGGVAQRSRARRAARQQNEAIAQQQQSGQAAYNQALSTCLASHTHPNP
jgi:outer membrane lipoprotein SlyB